MSERPPKSNMPRSAKSRSVVVQRPFSDPSLFSDRFLIRRCSATAFWSAFVARMRRRLEQTNIVTLDKRNPGEISRRNSIQCQCHLSLVAVQLYKIISILYLDALKLLSYDKYHSLIHFYQISSRRFKDYESLKSIDWMSCNTLYDRM